MIDLQLAFAGGVLLVSKPWSSRLGFILTELRSHAFTNLDPIDLVT
ncbi:hypothetical protein [uncultured Sunxiuqinia sp.]|nr:hypothetical protein [uncultured Sunxiuqinia sp.]